MKRILATYIKEWHLMRRDIGGLALLFIMPMLLITIMALVQDAPFKDYKDNKFETLFLNEDQGKVADSIKQGLLRSNQFLIVEKYKNQNLDKKIVSELIQNGTYKIAIIIPKGTTAEIVNSANLIANEMGKHIGIAGSLPHRESRDSMQVQVMFDPVSKPTFKVAILNAIEKFTTKIQSEIILERISKLSNTQGGENDFDIEQNLRAVGVSEISSFENTDMLHKMNSVQHNVPAWAIFGMFFMAIVISDNLINERSGGSWTRLKLIPGQFAHVMMGKVLFYILLGVIQFFLMLFVGVYLMPLLGLDALKISTSPLLLIIMVIAISACATSMGILIGNIFKTSNQALPVAAISVVILSAIGGVWVPIEVLPPLLKKVSMISPLRWGLEGINSLLLRDCNFKDILLPLSMMIGGTAFTLVASWWIEKNRSGD